MECKTSSIFLLTIKSNVEPYIHAYIVALAVITITGNALLIWLLKKTRQTNTISFQFIIIMSISDLILSTGNLIVLIINNLIDANTTTCWIVLFFQFIIATCGGFSVIMATYIALDRYLHMKYLERYPSIVTKKRAYSLTMVSFLLLLMMNAIFALPMPNNVQQIFQAIYLFSSAPIALVILILYYYTMKTIRKKASELTGNLENQTRTLSKALKAIAICTISLLIPLLIIKILQMVNKHYKFSSFFLLDALTIFSFVTFSSNAFWSSFVFMLLNRPIRLLLKRNARRSVSCRRGAVESTAENG